LYNTPSLHTDIHRIHLHFVNDSYVFSLLKKPQLGLISSCHRFEYNVQVMFHRTSRRNRVYRLTITSSCVFKFWTRRLYHFGWQYCYR